MTPYFAGGSAIRGTTPDGDRWAGVLGGADWLAVGADSTCTAAR